MAFSGPLLRPERLERHRRHLSLPGFGVEGRRKLLEGSVLPIGVGVSAVRIGLVDLQVADAFHLQRRLATGPPMRGGPSL